LNKISIRDGVFRKVTEKGEIVIDNNTIDVIIVNAAGLARMYYEGEYTSSNASAPVCWSSDTRIPDLNVVDKQSARCFDCSQNIKGSAQGNARACKYSQRIAVVFEDDLQDVYQLQLPATALFGDAERGWQSMQNYAKHLAKHDTQATTVVTRITFEESYIPRLRFRPMRVLKTAESSRVAELENDPSTIQAITLDVKPKATMPFAETDGFVFDEFN
jgi:hypothetical protein